MIATLADAWSWYESAKKLLLAMRCLGDKYWETLAWDEEIGRDNRLRELAGAEIVQRADVVLSDLDNLCVLLLFSVFEAIVRDSVLMDITAEIQGAYHPAIQQAIAELKENIEQGSFYRVLQSYKTMDVNLVEEVNQVRKFRNWVAHGRRGTPENRVDPRTAYARLQNFLDRLKAVSARASQVDTPPEAFTPLSQSPLQ